MTTTDPTSKTTIGRPSDSISGATTGPATEATTEPITDPIAAYGAAWLESAEPRRRLLLETAWAADAVYCDPLTELAGREALSAHIAATQAQLAGGTIAVVSEPVRHHDSAFFRWSMADAAGSTLLTGWDVVQLDDAGRIARLTGFFDTDTERRDDRSPIRRPPC
jgi:hypothetical protein